MTKDVQYERKDYSTIKMVNASCEYKKGQDQRAACRLRYHYYYTLLDTNGIVFYCGNLPPGNTKETLTMFLEEEGIHPKISLSTVKKWDTKDFMGKLTPKQRGHKKNMMRAAKAQ